MEQTLNPQDNFEANSDVFRFEAVGFSQDFYNERTDRNIGWITREEQEFLRSRTVGIAGCGGMGGLLASIFVRLGIGEVRIADSEVFDISNMNRQYGASHVTVGKSKALETARMVRDISRDSRLVVYTRGIQESNVHEFVSGCDVICDEIEVLAVPARILLHRVARDVGVSLFNCNTVGFSTNLFLYEPDGMKIEDAIGLSYEHAKEVHARAEAGDQEAINSLVDHMINAVVPSLPEYSPDDPAVNRKAFFDRLKIERKAPIIATNPPLAGGFLADRVLLYLLRNSGVKRKIAEVPTMPGYLHFDAATMKSEVVTHGWDPRA